MPEYILFDFQEVIDLVTRLQRAVEIVEDRHINDTSKDNRYSHRQMRGSVINATPAELAWLHRLANPMNGYDNHVAHHEGNVKRANSLKERLGGQISYRHKNA